MTAFIDSKEALTKALLKEGLTEGEKYNIGRNYKEVFYIGKDARENYCFAYSERVLFVDEDLNSRIAVVFIKPDSISLKTLHVVDQTDKYETIFLEPKKDLSDDVTQEENNSWLALREILLRRRK